MHLLCSRARMIEANPKHPSTPIHPHSSIQPANPLSIYPILPNPN